MSMVMNHLPDVNNTPELRKKISTAASDPPQTFGRPGLRHSISEPANEKLFMEAAAASATPAGIAKKGSKLTKINP